jgi:hypothetical protein
MTSAHNQEKGFPPAGNPFSFAIGGTEVGKPPPDNNPQNNINNPQKKGFQYWKPFFVVCSESGSRSHDLRIMNPTL